jgi:hypothetical protein
MKPLLQTGPLFPFSAGKAIYKLTIQEELLSNLEN